MKPILMVVQGFINVYLLGEGDLCMCVIVLCIISFLEVLDVVWFTINLHPLFSHLHVKPPSQMRICNLDAESPRSEK